MFQRRPALLPKEKLFRLVTVLVKLPQPVLDVPSSRPMDVRRKEIHVRSRLSSLARKQMEAQHMIFQWSDDHICKQVGDGGWLFLSV